ncbi:MAG: AsmA family protein [Gammaproteobacteria bacterium]|nr:AsmA family protein [Gammaproteobacteria bacterium]
MTKIIKIIAGLVGVSVIALVAIISTSDISQYKGQVIQLVEDATGRQLEINGDMRFALSLVPTVVVEDVTFSNASWGSRPEMVSLKKFEIEVALLPLITGDIQLNRIILIDPDIVLETNKKGTGNWVFASKSEDKQEKTTTAEIHPPKIVVNEVHIKNASVIYIDGITGQHTKLVIDQITAESDSVNDPLSLMMKVAYNAIPISVSGHLGSFKQLTANEDYPLDLTIEVSDARLALNGKITKPMDAKGINVAVKFDVNNLNDLSKLAGSNLPDFGPVALSGTLIDGVGSYAIKSLALTAGNTDLSGELTANIASKRPSISAKFNSNLIDLVEFAGDEASQPAEKKDRVFSSEPLPLEALKSVNANVSINAKHIKTASMDLSDTNVTVLLKEGNLTIKPLSSVVAGGKLAGSVTLTTSGQSGTLMTNITIAGLEPNQLKDLNGKLTGAKTDVTINIAGSGDRVSQIMAGSNGTLLVKVGNGVITDSIAGALGADVLTKLVSMLNPFAKSNDATQLQCAVVNFDIKNGIATTDKGIAISTNQMNIIGSGTVNLKTEVLDIGIKPEAKEGVGINAGKLASVVRVGGTLAQPKPTADMVGAVSTGLSVGTAVATGGLSLLAEGLFDRVTADADPCATALGQKPTTSQTAEEPEKSTSTKAVDSVKDAGGAISNTLKGLFN